MSRGVSAKVVPISRARGAVRRLPPQRKLVALGARNPVAARGAAKRVTPAWVCIASLVAVTMWPSAAVLLSQLALRILWR